VAKQQHMSGCSYKSLHGFTYLAKHLASGTSRAPALISDPCWREGKNFCHKLV